MIKTLILTLSILLFAHPSARAKMAMTIHSGQVRADDIKPEEKEISAFDYEALALLSVDLNPDENPDEVISLLEPYKDGKNNQSFIFYSSLGLAYKNKERFKEAIAAYVRSLELEPDEPAVQYYLGIAYYKNNELPRA
ncbi:MAG: tetratricopeptide repeat protein, partial [Thermodesulfobacteriota bacterium]